MRLAVLSDVHSNLEALEAVLSEASADRVVVLGDLVGYGADPQRVLERLSECSAFLLAGNHDLALTDRFDLEWFNSVAAEAVVWTRENIDPDMYRRIEALKPVAREDSRILVHGSVVDPAGEYLRDTGAAATSFDSEPFVLGLFGHTHIPFSYELENGQVLGEYSSNGRSLSMQPGVRYLLNPGSVGQPRDGDERASYLVIEGEVATWHRVPYDIASAQRKIREAGLPSVLADRLAVGR